MPVPIRRKFILRVRRYFLSGLLVWIPIWVTVVVVKFLVELLDQTILLLPVEYRFSGLGVIITLCVIFLTGFLASNFLGKQLVFLWDAFIARIPLVRTIHVSVKQILQTIITPEGQAFRKVLLVEFPRKGMWTVAFQTGEGTPEFIESLRKEKLISLFIPTTPNITSGFLVIVPEEDVIESKMTIQQALKFTVSLGVMQPEETIKK